MESPIFLIGCPRSGTTLALYLLAIHDQTAWISNYVNRFPHITPLASLNRQFDLPLVGRNLYKAAVSGSTNRGSRISRLFVRPVEPWNFWESYLKNFRWPRFEGTPRRRTANDTTPAERAKTEAAINRICRYHGKPVLLSKYTDFPRINYLTSIFPNARFIHIVRDGRAVAASYQTRVEKGDFNTWQEREWWMSAWPDTWRDEWRSLYSSLPTFLAYQWKFFVSEIWNDAQLIPSSQYTEVNYRDIVENPQMSLTKLIAFCELEASDDVTWLAQHMDLRNENHKWVSRYTNQEQEALNEVTSEQPFASLLD